MTKKVKRSTRRDAMSLTMAVTFKSALQLLTPLVLVRLIDPEEFGEYRLIWLIANTATTFLALGIDRSLLYFLPRSEPEERQLWVTQTAFYFLTAGVIAGVSLDGRNSGPDFAEC
jgi:O-antigen/teichoic acid export membrane protein